MKDRKYTFMRLGVSLLTANLLLTGLLGLGRGLGHAAEFAASLSGNDYVLENVTLLALDDMTGDDYTVEESALEIIDTTEELTGSDYTQTSLFESVVNTLFQIFLPLLRR